jgi:hypothetical protein
MQAKVRKRSYQTRDNDVRQCSRTGKWEIRIVTQKEDNPGDEMRL